MKSTLSPSPNHHQIIGNEESLIDYAIELSRLHANEIPISERKKTGQIFTPKKTAMYMAGFFDLSGNEFSLLDPGSGTGNLLSAVCQRIINEADHTINVRIDAFESDISVIPYLEKVLCACKNALNKQCHSLQYNIISDDFIIYNQRYLDQVSISGRKDLYYYDAVISNPPYYKLKKESIQAAVLKDFISGQPNIYSHFMILSAHMLKKGGEFVSITPRSFCSGSYYKKVRNWFVNKTCIDWIHSFESRKNKFVVDDILQENVIIHAIKTNDTDCSTVYISSSFDNTFGDYKEIDVPYPDIIYRENNECFIRIPTSDTELKVIETVDSWQYTLKDFGLRMSTGPVVDFRTRENLRNNYSEENTAPLIWMQNLKGNTITWPLIDLIKPQAIEINSSTIKILLPVSNYILIKRFTSKEQKRRIFATPLQESEFTSHEYIGLENHLNYIHRPKGKMTVDEVCGLTILFNTELIDRYFRVLNGNTQVNASEINLLPLPDISIIRTIGRDYQNIRDRGSINLDDFISQYIEIEPELINNLTKSGDI